MKPFALHRAIFRIFGLGGFLLAGSVFALGQGPDPGSMASKVTKPTTCSDGQVLKWNASTSQYECQDDAGGGSTAWSGLTNSTANLSLSHGAFTTAFTWGATTGAGVNLFTLSDSASNTGTGYLFSLNTATGSALKPLRFTALGTANGVEMTTSGVLEAIGTGGIRATDLVATSAAVSDSEIVSAYSGVGSCAATQWVNGLTRDAAPTCAQPAFSDLTGSAVLAQLPVGTAHQLLKTNAAATSQEHATLSGTGSEIDISFGAGTIQIGLVDPLVETKGGTGQSAYTLGDILYSDISNSLARLAGNTTTTKQFLTQTGDGVNSAAPAWGTIADGDIPASMARDTESPAAGDISGSLAAGYTINTGAVGSAELATANKQLVHSINIFDPATGDTNKVQHKFAQNVTLQRVSCSTDAGTVDIQFDERAEGTPNTAGTNVLSATLQCTTSTAATTAFANAGIAADAPLNLQILAVASGPTVVRIHIDFQID